MSVPAEQPAALPWSVVDGVIMVSVRSSDAPADGSGAIADAASHVAASWRDLTRTGQVKRPACTGSGIPGAQFGAELTGHAQDYPHPEAPCPLTGNEAGWQPDPIVRDCREFRAWRSGLTIKRSSPLQTGRRR